MHIWSNPAFRLLYPSLSPFFTINLTLELLIFFSKLALLPCYTSIRLAQIPITKMFAPSLIYLLTPNYSKKQLPLNFMSI